MSTSISSQLLGSIQVGDKDRKKMLEVLIGVCKHKAAPIKPKLTLKLENIDFLILASRTL